MNNLCADIDWKSINHEGEQLCGDHIDIVEQDELRRMLADSLELLTEKERKVILLYYYEELTLKEVSNVLEVSESRVSQLHIKALAKMKKKLGKYMGYLTNPNE